jgi:hypothetical protein
MGLAFGSLQLLILGVAMAATLLKPIPGESSPGLFPFLTIIAMVFQILSAYLLLKGRHRALAPFTLASVFVAFANLTASSFFVGFLVFAALNLAPLLLLVLSAMPGFSPSSAAEKQPIETAKQEIPSTSTGQKEDIY